MTELVPLLQIFHLSDLHFVAWRGQTRALDEAAIRLALTSNVPPVSDVGRKLGQGCAGHSSIALRALRDSIVAAKQSHANDWEDRSLIVVTGDLTTWGDWPSRTSVAHYLSRLAEDTGIEVQPLYGNHDVWPGNPNSWEGLPVFHSDKALADLRTEFRGSHFTHEFPVRYARPIPEAPSVSVSLLNTIQHERVENQLALGRVSTDFYWDETHVVGGPQLDLLSKWTREDQVAVVLTHHPVLSSEGRPIKSNSLSHGLRNGDEVIDSLSNWNGTARALRCYLSGHTHAMAPEPGQLVQCPVHQAHRTSHIQLVTGTAAQRSFYSCGQEQTWALYNIYYDPDGEKVLIERIVFARPDGRGPYEAVGDEYGNCAEVAIIPLVADGTG